MRDSMHAQKGLKLIPRDIYYSQGNKVCKNETPLASNETNKVEKDLRSRFAFQICREEGGRWLLWVYFLGCVTDASKFSGTVTFVECSSAGKFNKKRADVPIVSIDVGQHDVDDAGTPLTLSDGEVLNELLNADGALRFSCRITID